MAHAFSDPFVAGVAAALGRRRRALRYRGQVLTWRHEPGEPERVGLSVTTPRQLVVVLEAHPGNVVDLSVRSPVVPRSAAPLFDWRGVRVFPDHEGIAASFQRVVSAVTPYRGGSKLPLSDLRGILEPLEVRVLE